MKKLVSIDTIKENSSNPRFIKDDKYKKLLKSLKEFPQMLEKRPIVVDESNTVLGGNMRLKACKELGLKEIWIDKAEGWTEKQKSEFIIKDNVGYGEWDWDILANEWDSTELIDWGLDVPDFQELDPEPEAEEDGYIEPDNMKVDVVLGDLIEIGEHRLLCGDSTDLDQVAKLMNGKNVNLLTDPPYGINANKQNLGSGKKDFYRGDNWDNKTVDFYYIFSLVDKAIVWGGNYFAKSLDISNDWLCWYKNNDGLSFSEFELAWTNLGKNCRHLIHNWSGELKLHPTQKPVKVIEWCINMLDEKPILDLFLGSGTTMVASHQLNRKCYGMELDPEYCQLVIDRMKKLDDTLEIKINGKNYEKK